MSRKQTILRWLRRIGIAIAVLLVLIGVGLWWLLGTESGLHFALARVTAASNGAIAVEAAQGDLAGPTQLTDVSYRNRKTGMRAHVDHIKADVVLWSLLGGQLHFADLQARGVTVALPAPAEQPAKSSSSLSLQPPMNLVLDHAHVSNIRVSRAGKPLFVANTLDLAGSWTDDGLSIRQLTLDAPKGHAMLAGSLNLGEHRSGKGHGRFHWTVNDTRWAGTLDAQSDGQTARVTLHLTGPMNATAQLALQQRDQLPWTLTLDAPTFDTRPILGKSSIKTLALALQGHGDRHGGTLTGRITLNQTRLQLQPLTLRYDADTEVVHLKQLVLTSPDIEGKLAGSGTIDLSAQPARADLALKWNDVLLPEKLAGQKLASAGHVTLAGSAEHYHLQGDVTLGPPKQQAHLTLDLAGTPQLVTLDHLTVTQPKGHLTATGTITLKPRLAWKLAVDGKNFNPGLLLAGWKGALDLALATHGRVTPAGPDATFQLARLGGRLRQRKLGGHGTLHVNPNRVLDGQLALSSGDSRIVLNAHGTERNHIDLHLAVVTLNDWLPDASGALHGHVRLQGLWPKLALQADLQGENLAVGARGMRSVQLTADVPDISHPGGTLNVDMRHLLFGRFAFDSIRLTGKGDADHHTLHLDANGQPLSLTMALSGAMQGKAWHGTLSTLDLDMQGLPPWRLQQPAQLAWDHGKASLSRTCLTAGTPLLCVSASKERSGALKAAYQLQQIPLALIATAAGEGLPLNADGVINGEGQFQRNAAGELRGHATLTSPEGSITYVDRPQQPLLAYRNFDVDAKLAAQRKHVTVAATFAHGGNLDGTVDISGPQQALSGNVAIRLDSLAPVELFTNMLANVEGHLDAHFGLGGTLDQPALQGQAALQQFAAEVPALGLKLHDGQVRVATTDARQLQLDGHIGSGKGTLQLSGLFGLSENAPTRLHVRGDNVQAANIPAAAVTVSPDLTIKRNQKALAITGKVRVDKATVKIENLPGAGATQGSPDVVVVDAKKKPTEKAPVPVSVDVTVDLGQDTHIIGYGLDGTVSGELNVHQSPGATPIGRGQIVVNGTYKAYGQDLVIKEGRLLFAGTPVANPGLDIRAVRVLHPNATISDHEVVGLHIGGTAQQPVLTVFSNPPMDQSDALSYLITGKPLSEVRGGEGNLVGAAAQALGSATGDLLAKGIGARLGVNAGVSNSEALGTAAFTVGKYLSPSLYLSYGVGLFDPGQVITLRYILSSRWSFEAVQATEFSRAVFNYRLER